MIFELIIFLSIKSRTNLVRLSEEPSRSEENRLFFLSENFGDVLSLASGGSRSITALVGFSTILDKILPEAFTPTILIETL